MSLQSLYIHGIDAIEARPIEGSNALEIRLTRDDSTVFEIVAFNSSRVPTAPLLPAVQAALRALNEALEGEPANVPLGVREARDVLADALKP